MEIELPSPLPVTLPVSSRDWIRIPRFLPRHRLSLDFLLQMKNKDYRLEHFKWGASIRQSAQEGLYFVEKALGERVGRGGGEALELP